MYGNKVIHVFHFIGEKTYRAASTSKRPPSGTNRDFAGFTRGSNQTVPCNPMKSLRNSYVPDWLPHNAAYI